MAIGNVIGSSLFNILVILGLTGLVSPMPVPASIVNSDIWCMLGVTAVLLPILLNGRRINRWEGVILLSSYGAYLAMLLRK